MKVIIASNNKGKIKEYKEILEPMGYEVLSQVEANIELEVEENGTTYEENAKLKAEAIYSLTKTAVLADDSGISIDYFDGAPGVYSARFKPELNQEEKNLYVVNEMKSAKGEERNAQFVCCIYFIKENGERIIVQGVCNGTIAEAPKGNNGFGYDPIFETELDKKTMAEITDEEKNKISHRAIAIQMLKQKLV